MRPVTLFPRFRLLRKADPARYPDILYEPPGRELCTCGGCIEPGQKLRVIVNAKARSVPVLRVLPPVRVSVSVRITGEADCEGGF